jgi:hypothetical protein
LSGSERVVVAPLLLVARAPREPEPALLQPEEVAEGQEPYASASARSPEQLAVELEALAQRMAEPW